MLALAGASLLVAPGAALAQTDTTSTKPQLNTAPPGAKPQLNTAPPASTAPSYPSYEKKAPRPAVPVPAPPPIDEPLPTQQPRPNQDNPSGLSFPKGTSSAEQPKPVRKYFLYTNFGLGYTSFNGQGQFNAGVAPAIGYRVNDRFSVGPGISYSYISVNNSYYTPPRSPYIKSVHYNNVGVKAFAQYRIIDQFFLHGEYEVTQLNAKGTYDTGEVIKAHSVANTLLAGAGYRQEFSDRFAADIVILYNFNDGVDSEGYRQSPYGQPEIRFNFLYYLGK
ncbi:hypothetical protein GCM10011383_20640 [Hymenobacter cavernae]|uniref:Outer membrane protein beta-barrel domain-containing protein n=2 Tax=Hymenobacter cavernae TaxID=2044852 RepID=A0ABQ1U3G1_9BACT|nr:hypothetical protein GCM10011383_20640 [Hymenobacter cavernae]